MLLFLAVLVAAAAAFTLIALLRGLGAFSQSQTVETQSKQTQMMFARVKWQAIAILLVVIIAFVVN
jgi:hypothetical protein